MDVTKPQKTVSEFFGVGVGVATRKFFGVGVEKKFLSESKSGFGIKKCDSADH